MYYILATTDNGAYFITKINRAMTKNREGVSMKLPSKITIDAGGKPEHGQLDPDCQPHVLAGDPLSEPRCVSVHQRSLRCYGAQSDSEAAPALQLQKHFFQVFH